MPSNPEANRVDSRGLSIAVPLPVASPSSVQLRAAMEVSVLVGGLFALLWAMPILDTPYSVRYVTGGLLLAFVLQRLWAERIDVAELGLAWSTFVPAVRNLALPTVVALLALVSLGWALDGLRVPNKSLRSWMFLPVWAFLQQFLLLGFCHRRLRVLTGGGLNVTLASALLFGVIHAPNPPLMLACSLAGFLWAAQFERLPNLYAIALSHAVLSTCLSNSLPKSVLASMRVGYRYLLH